MRREVCFVFFCLFCSSGASAQAPGAMSDIDVLVNWRDLGGQTVTMDSCRIAGTTSGFVRCEVRGDAGSIALDAATMDKEDLKFAYSECAQIPQNRKPECRVVVTGTVLPGGSSPWIKSAKFSRQRPK
ncbi:hypothetical protein FNL56_13275 [Tardiphaga sp. vice304]|uniref:hypothetical protein n=1 Tax=Tardiphaga sp. vice304 TaxID=2592817 RepID=UPI0011621F39|nr:hypothetical protein [Tardiphaga sp. vice304]QDM26972.1 hypothetical protein FNL56_13275 [Tardiphaga sp. vice304]